MQNKHLIKILVLLVGLLVAGCSTPAETPEAKLEGLTPTQTAAPARLTQTPGATRCAAQPVKPTAMPTLEPTATRPDEQPAPSAKIPELILTAGQVSTAGTALPPLAEISAGNVTGLRLLAQWGRGSIRGAAFAPDGASFVVGSDSGIAVYSSDSPESLPIWLPFPEPTSYSGLYYSQNGNRLLLEGDPARIFDLATGQFGIPVQDEKWVRGVQQKSGDRGNFVSPDGKYRFTHMTVYDENNFSITTSIREVYENDDPQPLYRLPDETLHITYTDRNSEPEGCDLSTFSYCGNVYDPMTMEPYQVGFSPRGDTLSILYRSWEVGYSNRFSVLRIYDLRDGRLLHSIGSFDQPVETFAYSPDGATLLLGHVDGRVELRGLPDGESTFTSQHFNDQLLSVAYTHDGRFVVLQRPNLIELRSTRDGSVHARYGGVEYTLSPTRNWIAIGDADGSLHVEDLDSGKTLYRVQAHADQIYALAFSPDGSQLVSSGQDCDVRAWESQTGRFLHLFEENWTNAYGEEWTDSRIFIYALNFIPGIDRLIGYGSWGRVAGWDTDNGATSYLIEPEALEYYNGMMTLNPHFPEYFGVDQEAGIFAINQMQFKADSGVFLPPVETAVSIDQCYSSGPVSRDGSLRISLGARELEGSLCLTQTADQAVQHLDVLPAQHGLDLWLEWAYLSPDGRQLLVSTGSGQVLIYGVPEG